MNSTRLTLALLVSSTVLAVASPLSAQGTPPAVVFPAASPLSVVKQRVGLTDFEINYSRPSVKERKIFGGLVPFGTVWRTGANSATKLTFSTEVTFGGVKIPAGTYELFSIPNPTEWTIIIHKDSSQWGAYQYDAKNDIARLTAKPMALATPIETFTIAIGDLRDTSATLSLAWENTSVSVPIGVDVVTSLVPKIEALMSSDAEKKPYANAAMFYLEHGLDLKKATLWIEAAIAAQPKALHLQFRKARILAAAGDKPGALAAANATLAAAEKAGGASGAEYVKLSREFIASLK